MRWRWTFERALQPSSGCAFVSHHPIVSRLIAGVSARLLTSLLLFLMCFSWANNAHAEVWGYIDERGVAHFAPVKLDARYELFFKDGQGFDSKQGLPKGSIGTASVAIEIPRPIAVPAGASKLIAFFEISTNYKAVRHLLKDAALLHNLDAELLQALISAESGFDAAAVSPKGAIGLMQLMPATAKRFGVQAPRGQTIEKALIDPRTNIAAGTRYLRELMNMFPGQLDLALAAYNAGEGAVQRAGNKIPNFKETQDYVRTVMQLYQWLKPPAPIVELRQQVQMQQEIVAPKRVRMEQIGGAAGRGNLPPPLGEALEIKLPSR